MEIDFDKIPSLERYKILTHVVVPRPIAWVTTLDDQDQVNAAPFSFFNCFGSKPALVVLGIGNRSDGTPKDTVLNIRKGGEFVINMVTESLAEKMVQTAYDYPHGESELKAVGLTTEKSTQVRPPRIAESPVHLECQEYATQEIGGNRLVIGKVIHAAIDDAYFDKDSNRVLTEQLHPVGRMHGPTGYTRTDDQFHIPRPTKP